MTLGETLRKFVPKGEQKTIAMKWLAIIQKQGKKDLTPSTVESQLSRLLNDDVTGVRLFFGDSESELMLLDVLDITEAQRQEIHELAALTLQNDGSIPPRLVIDLSGYSPERDAADRLFNELSDLVIRTAPLKPTLLLLSPTLYRLLPRDFDDASSWLRWEKVETDVAGAERARKVAGARALVASTWRFDPIERWAAFDFDGKRLEIEPKGAFETFSKDGTLALPAVVHDLSLHVEGPLPQVSYRFNGPTLRRMIAALRDEHRAAEVREDSRERLALARTLDVPAAATERDRIESEIRQATRAIGIETEATDVSTLHDAMSRAKRRPIGPLALRVGDEIHVVNPPESDDDRFNHSRVKIHRIAAEPPALSKILDALKVWTVHTAEADPYLLDLIQRLDPTRADSVAMLYARATLLYCGAASLAPPVRVDNWRGALAKILADDPPLASLRARSARPVTSSDPTRAWITAEPTDLRMARELYYVPGLSDHMIFTRADKLLRVQCEIKDVETWYEREGKLRLSFPRERGRALDLDTWLDLLDAWSLREHPASLNRHSDHVLQRARAVKRFEVTVKLEDLAASFAWSDADRVLALAWLALRKSSAHAEAVHMADGTVLLPLSAGIVAAIAVHATPGLAADSTRTTRAALDLQFAADPHNSHYGERKSSTVGAVASGVDSIVYHLPHGLTIVGHGLYLSIQFIGSPLHLGRGDANTLIAAARLIEADAAQRRDADYDDDD